MDTDIVLQEKGVQSDVDFVSIRNTPDVNVGDTIVTMIKMIGSWALVLDGDAR